FSSRRRHTRFSRDWSSDVCSSDLVMMVFTTTFAVLSQTFIEGKVVRVADGDSFTLLDSTNTQIRVRLYGVDCPEYRQDFSNVAKKFTSERIFGKFIKVEVLDVDRYDRIVALVTLPDGLILNKELLKAGLAWHYKYYDKSEEFAELERYAQDKKLGLWAQPNPVPPWEYRSLKMSQSRLY